MGVVIAAVFCLARTSQQGGGGWGVFLLSVYSSAFLIGADLCYILSVILESSNFLSLFSCDYLSVCVYVGLAEVYLQFSRGCWSGPLERWWVGLGSCPFCSVPSFVPGWMVSHD